MLFLDEEKELCVQLGLRLRRARIERQETQADLSARAGLSRQLVLKMEKGDPSVSLGKWIKATAALGLLETWGQVLAVPVDPFVEYDRRRQDEEWLKKTRIRHKK